MFMSTFNLFQATAGLDGAVILYDFESDYSVPLNLCEQKNTFYVI
jgi:hypothetical protein